MTVEQTLNVTVAQIEDALLGGMTVPDFAREWSEPATNVLAVYRRLQDEGRLPRNTPTQVASKPPVAPVAGARSLTSVPAGPSVRSDAPSVDALVSAAARSTSKRTQALGVKLHDLAEVVRQRLAEEREAAEKEERAKAEREAAAAEVARLEEQLRAAKAKLRPERQGGVSPVQRETKPRSTRGVDLKLPCRLGCDRIFPNAQGRGAHEKRTHGGSS